MTEYQHKNCELHLNKVLTVLFGMILIYKYYYPTAIVSVENPEFSLLGPYDTTERNINDTYNQLIDIKQFNFKINPKPCNEYSAGMLLMVIVSSNPTNFVNRMTIRKSWGQSVDSMKTVFLIGESKNLRIAQRIQKESLKHGDIVQGNFIDAYRNLTYKHVMGLKWVVHHCPSAKYVMKTDDDMVVNSNALRRFLAKELSPWGATGLITCQVLQNTTVQRAPKSKWRVLPTEYAAQFYPAYCAGWVIIYSQDVVQRLLDKAQNLSYFWIDDVQITGVSAQQLGIARTPLSSLILDQHRMDLLTNKKGQMVGPFLFGPPNLKVKNMTKLWKALPK